MSGERADTYTADGVWSYGRKTDRLDKPEGALTGAFGPPYAPTAFDGVERGPNRGRQRSADVST